MERDTPKINCPIFRKQEPAIKKFTDRINRAEEVREKARFAEKLQKEIDVLLNCQEYDTKKIDCKNCRFIANLRKRTAGLIMKMKKLE